MRNNKLIKAQFERLAEINMQNEDNNTDAFDYQDEAEIYGFNRMNI